MVDFRTLARNREYIAIALLGVASRVPFVGPGFGTDPDAWRVANTARRLVETGEYVPSRLPSYPVHEFGSALLYAVTPAAVVYGSVLAATAAAVLFGLALRRLGFRNHALLALALLFAPVVFVDSTVAMDYVWALCFLMAALLAAVSGRPLLSAAMVGLAVGSRLGSVVFMPAYAAYAEYRASGRLSAWRLAGYVTVAGAVALTCYAPGLAKYGVALFDYYPGGPDTVTALRLASNAFGNPALAAMAVGFGLTLWRLVARRAPAEGGPRAVDALFFLACAASIVALFVRFPYETSYILPVVPFLLALAGLGGQRSIAAVVAGMLLLGNFFDVNLHGRVVEGWLVRERAARQPRIELARRVATAVRGTEENAVVVCLSLQPWVTYELGTTTPEANRVLYGVTKEQLRDLKRDGTTIYYIPQVLVRVREYYGVDLAREGAVELRY